MKPRTVWIVLGSILAGLVLGIAIRRARGTPSAADDRDAPSREGVGAALLRAEIRTLDLRLGTARGEGERIEQERSRLAALDRPPAPLSFEDELRRDLRRGMENIAWFVTRRAVHDWLREDPANLLTLLRMAAAVVREKERSREELQRMTEFLISGYLAAGHFGAEAELRPRMASFLLDAQRSESDALVRSWILGALDEWRVALPADARAELAKSFREATDPALRSALLGHLMNDPESRALVAEAIRGNPDLRDRSSQLLKAWERRALPPGELRTQVREIMKSDRPEVLIQEAQNWVPKYINPPDPQETIGLFHGTLAKPIEPMHKAVSLMVMGSISSIFPGNPGRTEIARFGESTGDARLKEFAGKITGLIDGGKGFAEIRKLNPLEHGFEPPK
jgi:hypothetical protein